MAPTTMRVPDVVNTGKLRFRVSVSAGAPAFTVRVNTVPATIEQTPVPDSAGWIELDLTEGIYSVLVDLGAAAGSFESPPSQEAIVVASQTTEPGTIYVVDTKAVNAGIYACLSAADCMSGNVCSGGRCASTLPGCFQGTFTECMNWSGACYTTGGAYTPCNGGKGVCATGPFGDVCIPSGVNGCVLDLEPLPIQKPICGP